MSKTTRVANHIVTMHVYLDRASRSSLVGRASKTLLPRNLSRSAVFSHSLVISDYRRSFNVNSHADKLPRERQVEILAKLLIFEEFLASVSMLI